MTFKVSVLVGAKDVNLVPLKRGLSLKREEIGPRRYCYPELLPRLQYTVVMKILQFCKIEKSVG